MLILILIIKNDQTAHRERKYGHGGIFQNNIQVRKY